MSQGKGYIKLHRDIKECWIWKEDEPFTKRDAWIDLLLSANHTDKKILFEGKLKVIHAGQFLTSLVSLSDKWKWDRKKVRKFLGVLESDNMIITDRTAHGTTITLVNWDKYQLDGTTEGTANGQHMGQQRDNSRDTNNNDKECIKKDIYITRFEETYKIYPRKGDKKRAYACYQARLKEGYSEDELYAATQNYAEYCQKENRDQKYIKMATTFFGVNTPFVDYLPKEPVKAELNHKIFDDKEQYIPPYFGFPKEWFDGDNLVNERVTPIVRPVAHQYGWYEEKTMQPNELIEDYEARRSYYEQEHNAG